MKRLALMVFVICVLSGLLLSACAAEEAAVPPGFDRLGTQSVLETEGALALAGAARQTQVVDEALQATVIAEQLRATQGAAILQATLVAGADQSTATAMIAGTQQALQTTATSQAIVEEANRLYYLAEQQRVEIQRRRMFNSILGWTLFLVILGFLALMAWLLWRYLRGPADTEILAPYAVFDRFGRWVFARPGRALGPAKVVEAQFARPARPSLGAAAGATAGVRKATPPFNLPAAAPWPQVTEGWRGGRLPLGVGPGGLIRVDPQRDPQLLITGAASSGKVPFAVRPLAAAALANGWQVVIFDPDGDDLQVFRRHANAVLAPFDAGQPQEVIGRLRQLYGEVQRRLLLRGAAAIWVGTEERPPELMVVFNDFSRVFANPLSYPDRSELWQFARLAAAEGGQVGVHLALVMEDPGYSDLDLRFRRYASPVAFRATDRRASRMALNMDGAEELSPRQFIAVLSGQVVYGFAFAPDDGEIAAFLEAHPQAPLPAPEWVG